MNNLGYEHPKALDDINDSYFCTQGTKCYEQLKAIENMNYSRL